MRVINLDEVNKIFNELIYTKKQELYSDKDSISKSLRSLTLGTLEILQESLNKLSYESDTSKRG